MPKLNENYQNVKDSYLFAEIARRVKVYEETHPEKAADIIRLGIGDVTLPLTKSVIKALHEAVDSQAVSETFKGYGPEQGYAFAQEAIADYYARNGVEVKATDIFISDGAKSDTGNITELFAKDNVVLVPDPVYPVYVDTNTMDGKNIIYMNGTKENDFLPMPDENVKADIIYLCSPNNPTGACYNKEQLKEWVKRIEEFLENEMLLHVNPKSTILYAGNGIDFCGYIHYADHKKVRKSSIRKLRQDVKAYELGELPPEDFNRKYESRKGHLGHADTYHIAKAVEYELLFYEWERLEAAA